MRKMTAAAGSLAAVMLAHAIVALAAPPPTRADPLQGDGAVARTVNRFNQLMGNKPVTRLGPERDFGLPAHAAAPVERFEGILSWQPAPAGLFRMLFKLPELTEGGHNVALNQLPPLRMGFVQNGRFLIPGNPTLINTGSDT